jgi:hypothetical protein
MDLERLDCALVDREGRMVSYLASTLSADEAEAFEAHYFGCDQCWRELQQGLEIRAALTSKIEPASAGHLVAAAAMRRVPWRWVAAAATVVLVASVWRWSGSPPLPAPSLSAPNVVVAPPAAAPPPHTTRPVPPPAGDERALRSPSQEGLRPIATRDGNSIKVEWLVVDKAARYVLTIFAADATQVLRRETTTPTVVIEDAAVAGHSGTRLFARVEAVSALGVILASSPRVELPARR